MEGAVHCSTCLKSFANFKEYDEHVGGCQPEIESGQKGKNLSVKFAEICDAIKRKKKGSGNKSKGSGEEPKQEIISTSKDKVDRKVKQMKSESEEAEVVPVGGPKAATRMKKIEREKSEDELDEICVDISGPTLAIPFDAAEGGTLGGNKEEDYDGEDEGEGEDAEEKKLPNPDDEAGACACEPEPGPSWKTRGQGKGQVISTQTPYMRMLQGGRMGRVLQLIEGEWDAHQEGAASLPIPPRKMESGEGACPDLKRREIPKRIDKLEASYIRTMPGQEYSTPCPFAIGSFVDEDGKRIWICLACTMEEHAIPSRPMISCHRCDDAYHMDCVGMHGFARKEPWFCKRCIRDANLE